MSRMRRVLFAALVGTLLSAGVTWRATAAPRQDPASSGASDPTTTTTAPPVTLLPPLFGTTTTTPGPDGAPTTTAPGTPGDPADPGPTTTCPAPGDPSSTSTPTSAAPASTAPSVPAAAGCGGPATTTTTVPLAAGGEGDTGCSGYCPGLIVPGDAQAIIDAIERTRPNNNLALVAGEQQLLAAGFDPEQAARLAYGTFPVAGPAHWVDDWYDPRFTADTFRFHQGLDIIAAHGTPLRSPADGTVQIENSGLGGLSVKVVQGDGTFYYLAHMASTSEGLKGGQKVKTGDLVGYVGATGNAQTAHLHFGIYQRGSTPIPPKPLVDQWVIDAAGRLPQLLSDAAGALAPRAFVATALVRQLANEAAAHADTAPAGPPRAELLFAATANPAGGAIQLAHDSAAKASDQVDWVRLSAERNAVQQAWDLSAAQAWSVLGPLTPPALRAPAGAR